MKGMAYTPFAILAVTLLFLLFISPLDVYPDLVHQDLTATEHSTTFDRSLQKAFNDGFSVEANQEFDSYNQEIISQGYEEDNPQNVFRERFILNKFETWEWNQSVHQTVESDRRTISTDYGNPLFENGGLTIQSQYYLEYNLTDSNVGTNYNVEGNQDVNVDITGAADPLLTKENEDSEEFQYRTCGYERPAELLDTGNGGGVIHGYITFDHEDTGNDQIIVLEEGESFQGDPEDFKAVISENSVDQTNWDYWIENVETLGLNQGDSVIIDGEDDDLWLSRFREIINEDCYVETEEGPDVFSRLEGEFQSSEIGLTTFVDGTEFSGEGSNEGYIYFNEDVTDEGRGIKGVTHQDQGEELDWFSVSMTNIDFWDIESLLTE